MLAVIAILGAGVGSSGGAITYGTPDGDGHSRSAPYWRRRLIPDGTWAACSGTSPPTVFLTAAHCDLEIDRVAVTFDSSYDPVSGTIPGGPGTPTPTTPRPRTTPRHHGVASTRP